MVKEASSMKKDLHRRFAVVLVVVIIIAMVASGGSMFFSGSSIPVPNSNSPTNAPNSAADYQTKKVRIAALVERAKADPSNVQLQNDLANEYFDAGVAARSVAPTEAQENFRHALEAYQIVLKTNKDPDIMGDMATSAFYSGDNDLAEKSYQEALALKPDFLNGLINYGIFLSQAKQDWAGALNQWQKALSLAQNSSDKEQINLMISQAQSKLNANQSTNGISNPNPALKDGVANPASPGK
jgi:tetratricopeptide (TPR) repeat protein